MKKILVIFHDNNLFSGATKSILSNVLYLKKHDIKIYALVPKKEGELIAFLKKNGVQVSNMRYGGNVYEHCANHLFEKALYIRCLGKTLISYINCLFVTRKFRKIHLDYVYTNTSTIYLGAWLSSRLNVKHIWHFREFAFEDQNSIRIFRKKFEKYANNAYQIIMISKVLNDYYLSKYHFSNTRVLYNDFDNEYICDEHNKHEGTNILITGTLSKGKGQIVALEFIKKMKPKKYSLFIAGEKNSYSQYLENYVKYNNLENVHFCGLVKDMKELRKNMDFSLVCSTKEAFGRTIIEDMLAGVIVVGSKSGAVPELIEHGYNGFLFEENNTDSIVKVFNEVDDKSYDEIEKIRMSARQYAQSFTENKTAKEIYKIINS